MAKKKFRSGVLPRSLSLAKMTLGGALKTGWEKVRSTGLDELTKSDRMRTFIKSQAAHLTQELGELKGSFMKVGQVLSFYGEQFLPAEFTEILKTLQVKASPLDWATMEKIYRESLGDKKWAQLIVEQEPVGAASLGQVHSAVVKATGKKLALKAQYPGIGKAIDSDLRMLRWLLKAGNWIPFTPGLDRVFEEARRVLHQEVDYRQEFALTQRYHDLFSTDPRFIVPQPIAEFSSDTVLATTFEEGLPFDNEQVIGLSQARRDRLGALFFELFLKEVFQFHFLQTDPHFGNFRVRLDPAGVDDQIVCLDFGAALPLSADFVSKYGRLLRSLLNNERAVTRSVLIELGFLAEKADQAHSDRLFDLCRIFMEPVIDSQEYDWGKSNLAVRTLSESRHFIFQPNIQLPPVEMISLNRKAGGIYILMSKLGARFNARKLLDAYLTTTS
jgi:predicted unusual protein kinase regulating ubiquinone biosynthesis (AarF/ABC1/UbiB family)